MIIGPPLQVAAKDSCPAERVLRERLEVRIVVDKDIEPEALLEFARGLDACPDSLPRHLKPCSRKIPVVTSFSERTTRGHIRTHTARNVDAAP